MFTKIDVAAPPRHDSNLQYATVEAVTPTKIHLNPIPSKYQASGTRKDKRAGAAAQLSSEHKKEMPLKTTDSNQSFLEKMTFG